MPSTNGPMASGADGFRFDLVPVLGNTFTEGGFQFDKLDPNNVLNHAVKELPVRPAEGGTGVDLIAEPWAIGDGTYQLGGSPAAGPSGMASSVTASESAKINSGSRGGSRPK